MGCSKSLDAQNYGGTLILGDLPSSDVLSSPSGWDSTETDHYLGGGTVSYVFVCPCADARTLRDAMSQVSTDWDAISKIVGTRTTAQMKKIAEKYYPMYNRSLKTDFETNLWGKFEEVCIGRLHGRYEYEAFVLHKAVTDTDVDESAIVDVLCTKTNHEIYKIKEKYRTMYRVNLIKDVNKVIEGDFQNLIVSLLHANREEGPANVQVLAAEAKELRRSRTFKKIGIRLLTERSFDHLRALFEVYQVKYGVDLEKCIMRNVEVEGLLMSAILTIVKFIKDPLIYYSSLLHDARNGGNDNSDVLIRCILARCEIDMWDIKIKYHEIYNVILDDSILQNQSEDWMKVLRSLIWTPREVQKFNATDILDATFSQRGRVFKGMIEGKKQDWIMSEPNLLSTDRRLSAKIGYFDGTVLRPSEFEESTSTLWNSFTNLCHISLKQLPDEKTKSMTGPMSSLKNLDGPSKICVRRTVYGKTSQVSKVKRNAAAKHNSSNHDHVDRKKPLGEKTGRKGTDHNNIKRKSMVDRDIKVKLQTAKPENNSRATPK